LQRNRGETGKAFKGISTVQGGVVQRRARGRKGKSRRAGKYRRPAGFWLCPNPKSGENV